MSGETSNVEVLGTEIFDNGWTDCGDIAHPWGVGMPAYLQLSEFGRTVYEAFGVYPFLVGSALREKAHPRDIDVRLVLPMKRYLSEVGPAEECGRAFTRWAALSRAFSSLGREMTGLPIDFQIETPGHANYYRDQLRRRIGTGE